MTAFSAILLGISLVFMGIVIIGDALNWWKVDENIFGALAVLLATASKWVSAKVKKKPGAPEPAIPDEDKNGAKTGTAVLLIFSLVMLGGCGTMTSATKKSLSRYGGCVGNKALECLGAVQGESLEEKAVSYSACMAGHAVGCIPIASAKPNPPGDSQKITIDLVCLDSVFQKCSSEKQNRECIESEAKKCGGIK